MDTNETLRAHISALVDGELPQADAELAFAALQERDGKAAWDRYHLIRDTLRATPAPALSPGFAERLAARLAAEWGASAPENGGSADGHNGSANGTTESTRQAAILAKPGTS
jgi:sigma-E factor negative regulatory protein RseA